MAIENQIKILRNFRSTSQFELSKHEKQIILAYRQNPSMQSAVARLLGVEAAAKEQTRLNP